MNSEQRLIQEILDKQARGEKLTDREALMLAYSPYGTAARSSFNPVVLRTNTEQEE